MPDAILTQSELKSLLHYDPKTGIFTWLVNRNRNAKAGDVVGSINNRGYMRLMINRKTYTFHRLAFLYMKGKFPKDQVDHKDRNKTNNAFSNLRECTPSENSRNRGLSSNNSTGCTGVIKVKNKFQAQIHINENGSKKSKYLGTYDSLEEAAAAYQITAKNEHGEFYKEEIPSTITHQEFKALKIKVAKKLNIVNELLEQLRIAPTKTRQKAVIDRLKRNGYQF